MRISLLFLLCLVVSDLVAQQPTLELTYEYINSSLGEKRTVNLIINNQEALSIIESPDTLVTNGQDFNVDGADAAGRQVYRNTATGELLFRDFVSRNGSFEPCLVNDPLRYTWTFDPVIRKIGPYECQSAQTSFRGRAYTAWYTEKLSVTHGPWKFTGLPGAMVEIRSDDESISFRLLKVTTSHRPVPRITGAKEISMKEFVALREGSTNEFLNRLAAQLPRGAEISVNATKDHNLEISFDDVKR